MLKSPFFLVTFFLILFIFFGIFLYKGMYLDKNSIFSPLIDNYVPNFKLSHLGAEDSFLTEKIFSNKISLVNFWSSWCVLCSKEHDVIHTISNKYNIQLIGVNYKDDLNLAKEWLVSKGDPYDIVLYDALGNLGIDFGVRGTPETFLVDREGIILHKHTGILNDYIFDTDFLPIIKNLEFNDYEKRFTKISKELRCVTCQNQSVYDSLSPIAVDLQKIIQKQIMSGKNDQEIKQYMQDRYGEYILYKPVFSKHTLFLWCIPIILLLFAMGYVFKTYRS